MNINKIKLIFSSITLILTLIFLPACLHQTSEKQTAESNSLYEKTKELFKEELIIVEDYYQKEFLTEAQEEVLAKLIKKEIVKKWRASSKEESWSAWAISVMSIHGYFSRYALPYVNYRNLITSCTLSLRGRYKRFTLQNPELTTEYDKLIKKLDFMYANMDILFTDEIIRDEQAALLSRT